MRTGKRDPVDRPLLTAKVELRKENHPLVFCVVNETGNYKYFVELCPAFLKIRERKRSKNERREKNVYFFNERKGLHLHIADCAKVLSEIHHE